MFAIVAKDRCKWVAYSTDRFLSKLSGNTNCTLFLGDSFDTSYFVITYAPFYFYDTLNFPKWIYTEYWTISPYTTCVFFFFTSRHVSGSFQLPWAMRKCKYRITFPKDPIFNFPISLLSFAIYIIYYIIYILKLPEINPNSIIINVL